MVEVFKTNVSESDQARWLLDEINKRFQSYTANFDLDDCDRMMRIRALYGEVDSERVCRIVLSMGFEASVLSDDPAVTYAFESEL